MNFRITTLFFGLLLTTLFIFGLMIAHKKAAGDQSFVVPSLTSPDAQVDKIVISYGGKDKDLPDLTFEKVGAAGDRWFLKQGNQQVRVQGFRMNDIVKAVREAKHEEIADVSKDPKEYGLDKPQLTVTLSGKVKDEAREWKLFVGKESSLKDFYYVNSSERSQRAFAVAKRPIDGLFVKEPNALWQTRLFDFVASGVTAVELKKGDKELELKRDEGAWMFIKPPYGPAGADSTVEEKKPDEKPKGKDRAPIDSVKSLLDTIVQVTVDDANDFVPLGKSLAEFDLDAKSSPMRIEIQTSDDKKAISKEILLVGKQVFDRKDYYYARLDGEDGVMMLHKRWIEPLDVVLQDPGKIRSRDIASFDEKKIDAVTLKPKDAKDAVEFFKSEKQDLDDPHLPPMMKGPKQNWDMVFDKEKKKASSSALLALLDQVLGKKLIIQFDDEAEPDAKKRGPDWGALDKPSLEVAVYNGNAVERGKKEEKKDDKTEVKKEEKKEDKKDEKKEPVPTILKDAKAVVKLEFGTVEKDIVHVRRTLENGTVTRFTVKKELFEKIFPSEGIELAYLDAAVPPFEAGDAVSLKLERAGKQPLEFDRRHAEGGRTFWHVKDNDSGSAKLADSKSVTGLVGSLSRMPVKKWIKKLDGQEALDKFGLKTPAVRASVVVKKDALTVSTIKGKDSTGKDVSINASFGLIGLSASPFAMPFLDAAYAYAAGDLDKGETITIELGNETDVEKDKPGVFARHSGVKLLFLTQTDFLKFVKDADLRDRDTLMLAQAQMESLYKANAALNPIGALLFAGPHFSGQFWSLDADKVKDLRVSIRTQYEFRSFQFERKEKAKVADGSEKGKDKDGKDAKDAKDKEKGKDPPKEYTWHAVEKSGLSEFEVDSDKVKSMLKDFVKLRTDRYVAFALPGDATNRGEFKLGDKDYSLRIDFAMEDGKMITLRVGAKYQTFGHYATSSYWPETVFFLPASAVEVILRDGASHFAKERTAAN